MTEIKYIIISETVKNVLITHKILQELSIISKDFVFLLLIDNISTIAVSESEKVIRNARHIDICYHHIQNLIEKKIIEISHISTGEMTVNDLTNMLLLNKFKEFVELIRILKIEISSDDKISDSKASNDKFNNSETSNSKFNDDKPSDNKNDGNLVTNYYEAGKKADKEISFKTKEAE